MRSFHCNFLTPFLPSGIIRGGTADELHAEREARRLEIAAELDNTHYELFE